MAPWPKQPPTGPKKVRRAAPAGRAAPWGHHDPVTTTGRPPPARGAPRSTRQHGGGTSRAPPGPKTSDRRHRTPPTGAPKAPNPSAGRSGAPGLPAAVPEPPERSREHVRRRKVARQLPESPETTSRASGTAPADNTKAPAPLLRIDAARSRIANSDGTPSPFRGADLANLPSKGSADCPRLPPPAVRRT